MVTDHRHPFGRLLASPALSAVLVVFLIWVGILVWWLFVAPTDVPTERALQMFLVTFVASLPLGALAGVFLYVVSLNELIPSDFTYGWVAAAWVSTGVCAAAQWAVFARLLYRRRPPD